MSSEQDQALLDEVRKMRKLLELLAEPAIAERDAKLRDELRKIVGSSTKKQESVFLMDGSRKQVEIVAKTSVGQGHLSTMVQQLESAGLLIDGKKQPKLAISIPSNFFDANTDTKRR
jgi:hypothetical protein